MKDATRHNPFSPRSDRGAFPARTNPNRPSRVANAASTSDQAPIPGAAASYPKRCDPRSPKPLTDAQRELTVRHLSLAQSMARKTARVSPSDRDEFESAAFLALVEAAQAFDPSRSLDFGTYAKHHIRGALSTVQRHLFSGGWRGEAGPCPRFQPLKADSENLGRLVCSRRSEPVGAEIEAADDVEHWLKKLPTQLATVFRLLYLEGKTQTEAAVLVGCSTSGMSRLHRETLVRLNDLGWTDPTVVTTSATTQPTATVPISSRRRISDSWSASRTRLGLAS